MHEGMDFTAKIDPNFATGDGIVAQADNSFWLWESYRY
jgi:murein DD-endopeptidase MepM/ murein hydrolase activator NlpD